MKYLLALLIFMSAAVSAETYTFTNWADCKAAIKAGIPSGTRVESFENWDVGEIGSKSSKGVTWSNPNGTLLVVDTISLHKDQSVGAKSTTYWWGPYIVYQSSSLHGVVNSAQKKLYGICFLAKAQTWEIDLEIVLDGITTVNNTDWELYAPGEYPTVAIGIIDLNGFNEFTIQPVLKGDGAAVGRSYLPNYYKIDKVFLGLADYVPYFDVSPDPVDPPVICDAPDVLHEDGTCHEPEPVQEDGGVCPPGETAKYEDDGRLKCED